MLVLDSSVLIEITRGNPDVKRILQESQENFLAITTFTVHELFVKDTGELRGLISEFEILNYSYLDSLESATIEKELKSKGAMINKVDIFIAGICRKNGFELITADRDFLNVKNLKVKLIPTRK